MLWHNKAVNTTLSDQSTITMSPQNDNKAFDMCQVPYISVVGSLMYLAVTRRPDIAYAAGVLARFNFNPRPSHWQAAKHVLYYLKGTMHHKIAFCDDAVGISFATFLLYPMGSSLYLLR